MPRRHRKHGGEHEGNNERWLLTYSDMITLLMAFFIMMYSMSVLNLAKFNEVAFSIRSGFGGALKGGKHLLKYQPGRSVSGRSSLSPIAPMRDVEQRLVQLSMGKKLAEKLDISREKRGIVVSIAVDGLLFDVGSATIRPDAYSVLRDVAHVLAPLPNEIMVEGHTCSQPISTAIYPSNWELSSSRASSVVRLFMKEGIIPTRLIAVGYGDTRPRLPNDSEAHRAMNRRVDIVLLYDEGLFQNRQPGQADLSRQKQSADPIKPNLIKVWTSGESSSDGGVTP